MEAQTQYSDKDKIAYYKKRAGDKTLTEGQRKHASGRLYELTGGKQGEKPSGGQAGFTQQEKRRHYGEVSRGEKPVKTPSKFEPQRQRDYAKGQVDARDEAASIYGRTNFPDKEARKAYIEEKNKKNA